MNTTLRTLEQYPPFDKIIIHSLEMSLYQVSVVIEGEEHYITQDDGHLISTHNIVDMRRVCHNLEARQVVLRQQSAYDEMVGSPIREGENTLEIPLGDFKAVI
ncbi:DUF6482 family protein [Vibrio hangzhouensis]|uniref:Uncharacterized protein n=1 Tax=Vibrio hangzhouensis TaxID=462991 RepID=A0A1H5TCQ6_9VIBR|nr:DUF6482 family protein [Vibrio hangzhouensis]SEF60550.1 hypothetical protein SAMN04488244_102208 [Vibrio hangzhouensis]